MKGFDSKFLEELKNKNDIVDVIGRYVQLNQKGSNFWGRCPFHHEKTPSFAVNSDGQFYNCFGCHKSGDVISFIMEIENVDFMDAVKILAEKANMEVPSVRYDDKKTKELKDKKERALEVLRETALFYVSNLKKPEATAHVEYLIKRKITSEFIAKFGIGASLDFNGLPNYLLSKGYSYEEMMDAGVVSCKDGKYYDALPKRLIIPMINQFNQVIAFVGRALEKTDFGKYVNTRETIVFSKGNSLFNINNLKKLKNEKGLEYVILVEGHIDVISLYQAGFKNVVAGMGTALTKDHARILKRYSDKIYVCYDGDSAGIKATLRGLEILKEEGLEVKVVTMPEGLDPDDVIKQYGKEGYEKCLLEAKPLIDYKLEVLKKSINVNTIDGKRKYITESVKVIKESNSPAEQEDLLKILSETTKTSLEALKRELYSVEESGSVKVAPPIPEMMESIGDKLIRASRFILYSYLFNKPYANETDINEVEFTLPIHIQIKEYIDKKIKCEEKVKFTDLYEENVENVDELTEIARLDVEDSKAFDKAKYFNDCLITLKTDKIDKDVERLKKMFGTETDTDKRKEILNDISVLTQTKKDLLRK